MVTPAVTRFLDDHLHNLKDKQLELKRDEESYGNSPSEDDYAYLVEKYKATLDFFIQDVQEAVNRLPRNNTPVAAQGNNGNPSNQSNSSVNNASNNPRGGKRGKHKTRSLKRKVF